jgi:hypothetical protein
MEKVWLNVPLRKTGKVHTLENESPSHNTMKKGLLNLRGAGRALEMMSGLGGKNRTPTIKLPKLCTIR